ncbi:hypothetical protein DWX94_13645 [Coprococcus eutactus]|uniref:Uncharacterized protein n=1 Tax=Coprococcus eutactus TaxID=33043 RepID=A0A412IF21_9FIRM|nr:hypothetical protein DWX94_13645 [Coprococcus eutactus]
MNYNKLKCTSEEFPIIEIMSSESFNVNGDGVVAYAVTRVNYVSEGKRLDCLASMVDDRLCNPVVIKGLSYSSSTKTTVADLIIGKYRKFSQDDKFVVILLTKQNIWSDFHGFAGARLDKQLGIVIRYPWELENYSYLRKYKEH